MFCQKCGKKIDDDSEFCQFCGEKIKEIKQQTISQEKPNLKKRKMAPEVKITLIIVAVFIFCFLIGILIYSFKTGKNSTGSEKIKVEVLKEQIIDGNVLKSNYNNAYFPNYYDDTSYLINLDLRITNLSQESIRFDPDNFSIKGVSSSHLGCYLHQCLENQGGKVLVGGEIQSGASVEGSYSISVSLRYSKSDFSTIVFNFPENNQTYYYQLKK